MAFQVVVALLHCVLASQSRETGKAYAKLDHATIGKCFDFVGVAAVSSVLAAKLAFGYGPNCKIRIGANCHGDGIFDVVMLICAR